LFRAVGATDAKMLEIERDMARWGEGRSGWRSMRQGAGCCGCMGG
jgi:hypothetical protein